MVRIRPPNRPASAAALINQEWEGHGLNAQPPVDRGYRLDSQRPPSSVPGPRGDAGDDAKGKGKKKEEKSSLIINVHVREKIIPVNAGAGNQRVYWLGATAVTRYLSQPAAYTTNFSHEMTPKAVLAEDGAQLERTARVCDELADGAHVWIDVGDGALLSHVASRPFPDRQIFEPAGDDEFSEQIVWNESQPDMLDDEIIGIDPRLTMSYARTTIAKQPTFQEWQKVQPASSSSQEGLFEEFSLLWQQVVLDDMPGSTSWMNEVRLGLFHHFESIKYIFSAHSAVAADGSAFMSLLEFWGFCKRCALTSPYANLAKIDKMFATKQTGSNLHDPTRALSLPEFMAALTRISYLRQKNAAKPDVQLPTSLFQLIEDKILPLSPGFDSFDAARAPSSPFTSAAVRQKLTIHETRGSSSASGRSRTRRGRRSTSTSGSRCSARRASSATTSTRRSCARPLSSPSSATTRMRSPHGTRRARPRAASSSSPSLWRRSCARRCSSSRTTSGRRSTSRSTRSACS